MSDLILPERKTESMELYYPGRKPIGPVKIDWSNHMTKGLQKYFLFQNVLAHDLVTENHTSILGIPQLEGPYPSPNGLQIKIPLESNTRSKIFLLPLEEELYNGTLILAGELGLVASGSIFSLRTVDTSPQTIIYRATDNNLNFRINNNTVTLSSSKQLYNAGYSVKTLTWNDSVKSRKLYVDGKFESSSSTTFHWSNQNPNECSLYSDNQAGGNVSDSLQLYAMLYARDLSDTEILDLYNKPYQFLIPQ